MEKTNSDFENRIQFVEMASSFGNLELLRLDRGSMPEDLTENWVKLGEGMKKDERGGRKKGKGDLKKSKETLNRSFDGSNNQG